MRSARAAGLCHVSDAAPGIARRRASCGFRYLRPKGGAVRDRATLSRIRALAIPPAWRGVWICPRADGHVQATGRDARGRKQYRYHPRWREDARRDEVRPHARVRRRRCRAIHRRVGRDLARHGLPREKILATVVRLLETTLIRVGNEEYARDNDSFGLTTLRDRQVKVNGSKVRFHFRGKSGIEHAIELEDRRMAAIVKRVRELPGQELFQYVDEDGSPAQRRLGRRQRLPEARSRARTSPARTSAPGPGRFSPPARSPSWAGSTRRRRRSAMSSPRSRRSRGLLGNTAAVCRKCYIHPAVLESYLRGDAVGDDAALLRLLRRAGA